MVNNELLTQEIAPNFTTETSRTAERNLVDLIEKGQLLGVSVSQIELSTRDIIEAVESNGNGRSELVRDKLLQEGLDLESLPKEILLDRLLGIDGLLELNGKMFGIDVTTGKGTVLHNKQVKAKELHSAYNKLGIDHFVVLRLRQDVTDDLVLDFFGKLEDIALEETEQPQPFVCAIKYGVNDQVGS